MSGCRTIQQEIAAAAGEPLSAAIHAHLAECPECRAVAVASQRLADQGRAAHAADEPWARQRAAALARQGQAVARQGAFRPRLPRWGVPALSASVSAAAVILLLGFSPGQAPPRRGGAPVARVDAGTPRAGADRATPRWEVAALSVLLAGREGEPDAVYLPGDLRLLRNRAFPQPAGSGSKTKKTKEAGHE